MSVSISLPVSHTEKIMKSRQAEVLLFPNCLEQVMKHDARVLDVTSTTLRLCELDLLRMFMPFINSIVTSSHS